MACRASVLRLPPDGYRAVYALRRRIDDTVICILEGGFTTVERTLIDEKDVDAVLQVRRSFQRAMERQFMAVIEEALGRKVIAYMSQIHADPDLAVELFMLEPHEADQSE
jgi:uncharacterized protein YbcI